MSCRILCLVWFMMMVGLFICVFWVIGRCLLFFKCLVMVVRFWLIFGWRMIFWLLIGLVVD